MKHLRFSRHILLGILLLIFLSAIACNGVEVGIVDVSTPTAAVREPTPYATAEDIDDPTPCKTDNPSDCTCEATFVADVTVPDDTQIPAGTPFRKTWRLQNTGSCAWNSGIRLVFTSGDRMDGAASVAVESIVPQAKTDVSVDLVTPAEPGTYRGNWQLQTAEGTSFGDILYVQIVVPAADKAAETAKPAPLSGWTSYASVNPLLVSDLAFDAEHNPWAATNNGILAWNLASGEHTTLTTDDGLIDNKVRAISIASDGTVWAGTDSGLARFDGETWVIYDSHTGLGDNRVTALAFAPDGTLWVGTRKNLVSYTGDRWTIHTHAAGDVAITAVAVGADGTVWAIGRGCPGHSALTGVLYRLDGERLSLVAHDSPTPAAVSFVDVAVAPDGTVWATGDSGEVYHLKDGHLTTYTAEDGLVSGIVSDIAVTADGIVWVSTADNGVCRFDGTSWITYTTADGLISNQVHTVAAASDGSVWFGTQSGLSRYVTGE